MTEPDSERVPRDAQTLDVDGLIGAARAKIDAYVTSHLKCMRARTSEFSLGKVASITRNEYEKTYHFARNLIDLTKHVN